MQLNMQAREAVLEGAEWFVFSHLELLAHLRRYTACVIGSGAWATAAARMVAQNTLAFDPAHEFRAVVKMWVRDEDFEARVPVVIAISNDRLLHVVYTLLGAVKLVPPQL
jgi:hypothetical protein